VTFRAYHFVGATLRNGKPVPSDGEWLIWRKPLIMCQSGLHASEHPFDALQYAPGPILCLVDTGGKDILRQDDKLVCRRRRIVARFDATELLRDQARKSALSVIHLWNAPAVVRQYLETGDEALRAAASAAAWDAARAAAWDAARAAAWAAARDAAWAAARDAAWAAAWDAERAAARDAARAAAWDAARAAAKNRFKIAVDAKFTEMGVKP